MALLFQSNPDEFDLRKYLEPGRRESWLVTRYLDHMKPGTLALFWEAQGKQKKDIKGLYGWGIIKDEPTRDTSRKLRVPLIYIERWVSRKTIAGVPANKVLQLSSWKSHLLARMPIGTNFLVTKQQLNDLVVIVAKKYKSSSFPTAVEQEQTGKPLMIDDFEACVIEEESHG